MYLHSASGKNREENNLGPSRHLQMCEERQRRDQEDNVVYYIDTPKGIPHIYIVETFARDRMIPIFSHWQADHDGK